ncbi:MAG: Methionyl-tRNA formyltransferase [Candidatus Izimaplasma bacterium HR2]|nr:MAG: Methionyl-tRNA formyltransferase [Candidatus Izimaplasma bacterium HR2]
MNIVFMGTPNFSVRILEAVHKEYGVDLVVTQPDKLVGRKKILTFSPIKEKALELGIEVFQPVKMKEDYNRILEVKPDIIITAAYGQMIPNEVIDFPRLGAINVHGSLLPLLRGGAPIQRAIKRLYNTTGISIMYMAYKMDSGDVISQRSIRIMPNFTSGILFEKLSILGRDLLMETLPSIIEGSNKRIPQENHLITYAYNLKREEEKINWDLTMLEIDAHVRAFSPEPSCYTTIDGKNLKVLSVEMFPCENFEEVHSKDPNGMIVKVFKESFGVKCSNGVIKITKVQLEGKTKQTVKVFLNGAGRNLIAEQKQFK